MKSTVIPAQITTVEDKIVGSLSMTQIVILMVPVFFATLMFAIAPPVMHIALYKLPPVLLVVALCLILSLRIKDKVIASWLFVLLRFNIRAKYYVFNKNDAYLRDLPELTLETKKRVIKQEIKKDITTEKTFGLKELKKIETLIKNPNYSFSLKPTKTGGLYMAISEIKPKVTST